MISICDTLDKAIKFMELTIEYVSDPEIVEDAKQHKHNLEVLKDEQIVRKAGE